MWTRAIGLKRTNFKSSCNKNYLPWFSRFKFRNKIRESSWTGLCGDRPWILIIRLTTSITARLGPPVWIRATDGWPGTVPQQRRLPFLGAVKWSENQSKCEVKWSEKGKEVQCREGVKVGLMGRVYMGSKVVGSEGLGWKRVCAICVGKNIRNYIQYFLPWCCFPYVHFC